MKCLQRHFNKAEGWEEDSGYCYIYEFFVFFHVFTGTNMIQYDDIKLRTSGFPHNQEVRGKSGTFVFNQGKLRKKEIFFKNEGNSGNFRIYYCFTLGR